MAEFQSGAVLALAVKLQRHRDLAVARTGADIELQFVRRALQQCLDRHVLVAGHGNEGGIGAVFEKTADKIGEQIAVASNRRIDPAGDPVVGIKQMIVEALAHTMQALELEAGTIIAGKLQNGGNRQCIMGGKLRENTRPLGEHVLRAGEIGKVCRLLARPDRIIVKPAFLRPLDLGIPVGALDEAHHHAAAKLCAEFINIIDHGDRALLIGLDCKAKTIPAGKRRIGKDRGDHVERKFQPVGFFGIDGEIELMCLSHLRKLQEVGHEFLHHAIAVSGEITRMQRRKLDGNTHAIGQILALGVLRHPAADRFDRHGVGLPVTFGIFGRPCALAQHVEGMAIALLLALGRAVESVLDGFAEHEVMAKEAHGLLGGIANGRQAHAFDKAAKHALGRLTGADDAG